MLKKTITYENFNGEEVSEDFFFHLSKAELVELELGVKGGLAESLQKSLDEQDGQAIISQFKNVILASYGQRSADGKRFTKNQQLREEFESTEAYSTLFMELLTDPDALDQFINGIIPQDLSEEIAKVTSLKAVEEKTGIENKEPRRVTRIEVGEMSPAELQKLHHDIATGEATLVE